MQLLNDYGFTQKRLWALFMLCVVAVYWPGLFNEFNNWDDKAYILENPNLDFTWKNVKRMFLEGEYHGMYLPLTALSFSINWWMAGLSSSTYIIVNLLLHLSNTWLVFVLTGHLTKNRKSQWLVAMLFALHPVQPESVVYASGRRDVLFGFFFLCASLSYVKTQGGFTFWGYTKTLLFFILALFSKATAVVFLPVMLLYDWLHYPSDLRSIRAWSLKVPFAIGAAIVSVVTVLVSSTSPEFGASQASFDLPMADRLIQASYSLFHHFRLVWLPIQQSTIHPFIEPINKIYLLTIPGFIICGAVLSKYVFNKVSAFGYWFFLACIIPLIQLFPNSYSIVNEHYLYIPSIGVFLIIAHALSIVESKAVGKALFMVIVVGVLILGFTKTRERVRVYRNSVSFWSDAIKSHPEKAFFYMKRAMGHEENHDYDLALLDYQKTLNLDPEYFGASFNQLDVLFQMRRFEEAKELTIRLMRQRPDIMYLRFKLGLILIELNQPQSAIRHFKQCIDEEFELAYSYNNLGLAYLLSDSLQLGNQYIDRSLELNSNNELARYNKGLYHLFTGDTLDACNAIASSLPFLSNPIKRQMRYAELMYLCPEMGQTMLEDSLQMNQNFDK